MRRWQCTGTLAIEDICSFSSPIVVVLGSIVMGMVEGALCGGGEVTDGDEESEVEGDGVADEELLVEVSLMLRERVMGFG